MNQIILTQDLRDRYEARAEHAAECYLVLQEKHEHLAEHVRAVTELLSLTLTLWSGALARERRRDAQLALLSNELRTLRAALRDERRAA